MSKLPTVEIRLIPPICQIDRTQPFDPPGVIGKGWSFWVGQESGGGISRGGEANERIFVSYDNSIFDPATIIRSFIVNGDGRLCRFIKGVLIPSPTNKVSLAQFLLENMGLDARIGQCLIEQPQQLTLNWLHEAFDLTSFRCLGTPLRSPSGERCVLMLRLSSVKPKWAMEIDVLASSGTIPQQKPFKRRRRECWQV